MHTATHAHRRTQIWVTYMCKSVTRRKQMLSCIRLGARACLILAEIRPGSAVRQGWRRRLEPRRQSRARNKAKGPRAGAGTGAGWTRSGQWRSLWSDKQTLSIKNTPRNLNTHAPPNPHPLQHPQPQPNSHSHTAALYWAWHICRFANLCRAASWPIHTVPGPDTTPRTLA